MSIRLPRPLTKKRNELLYEREQVSRRLAEIDEDVAALDYAIRLLAPDWHSSVLIDATILHLLKDDS